MLDELEGPGGRATREFRQKFPDEIVTDNLGGQLWFGAECLAAGSSIMNKVNRKHFSLTGFFEILSIKLLPRNSSPSKCDLWLRLSPRLWKKFGLTYGNSVYHLLLTIQKKYTKI